MTAVFISGKKANLSDVYTEELIKKISESATVLEPLYSEDELYERRAELEKVDVIFSTWGMLKFSCGTIMKYFPALKALFYAAGTVKYFARPFLECGVTVSSAWQANGVPVAEVTFSEIMLANKGFFRRRVHSREEWSNSDADIIYPGNFHTKVGILGAGAIGKRVIALLKSTDLDIYVFDPFLSEEKAAELGVKKADLLRIFKTCNVISNHIANLPETVGLIGKDCFDAMRDGAVFINTGRGAQVDMSALVSAMKEKKNSAALLDVTDPCEPPEEGSELYRLDNVFLTPHIAGSIGCEVHRLAEYMYSEYEAFLQGKPLSYSVTLKMLETMA